MHSFRKNKTQGRIKGEIKEIAPQVDEFRKSLINREGPIPVLTLRGTSYEKGLAYGVLLQNELTEVYQLAEEWIKNAHKDKPWFKRIIIDFLLKRYTVKFIKRTPKPYIQEMKGVADGAGVSLKMLKKICSGSVMLMGCTSILSAQEEREGILHGRNFDFSPYFLGDYPIIIKYIGDSQKSEKDSKRETDNRKYAAGSADYWNIGVIGYLPSFNGLNAEGISVSLNMSDRNALSPDGMPVGWKIREVLEKSRNLADVRKIVQEGRNDNINWILTVGSAEEKSGIVFDLKEDAKAETFSKLGESVIVFNRSFGDRRHEGTDLERTYKNPLQAGSAFNTERWKRAQEFLKKRKLDSVDAVWKFLRNTDHVYGEEVFSTGYSSIVNEGTMFSMVFDAAHGRISIAAAENYASLRQVDTFFLENGRFEKLLDPDKSVYSENFKRREKVFLQLEKEKLLGTLSSKSFISIGEDEIDPLTLDRSGKHIGYSRSRDEHLRELIRALAMKYSATGFSGMIHGINEFQADPQRGIQLLQ
ncbi:MAG: hypothetical protein K9K80_02945, partial [Spirochaetia bacterium]|nr:hypothetical protein [Spirochaetia bacterium]